MRKYLNAKALSKLCLWLNGFRKPRAASLPQTACRITQIAFLLAYMLLSKNASAQSFRLYQSPKGTDIINSHGDTLQNPWSGGFINPQFSNINLDGDARADIFVFEPADGKVSIFLSLNNGTYQYMPQYESAFPKMKNWALLVDYNKDGKEDIFTYSLRGAGLDVYKNVSTDKNIAFEKIADRMPYQDVEFSLNLYVPGSDIPAIADIDNDGDIDILAYDVVQAHVQYYKNLSMEKYGKPDSLDYRIADRCWGKFAESFSANTVLLGEDCGKVGKREKQHGGSTLLAFDNDGDGDMDMAMGDIGYRNLIFLENGRIKNSKPFTESDSMILVDSIFPRNTQRSDVTNFPAAFLVDINADGIKDMIVSPQGLFESKTTHQVLAYINNGTNNKPNFSFLQDDFLQNTMLDNDVRSAPAFVDYNADGLMDLVVSAKANTETEYQYGKLQLYKNIGTSTHAVFKLVSEDLGNISQKKMGVITPTFQDINGDNKPDLVIGNEAGEVVFFYNQGLDANQLPTFTDANISTIDVGQYSKPSLADLDRDGLADLVIGEQSGNFNYYKNTGSATVPAFTLVSDTFGRVVTNHFYYEYEYDDSGKVIDSSLVKESNGASAPVIIDMDKDGKWDMVCGTIYGELFIYFDIEDSLNSTFAPSKEIVYNTFSDKNDAKNFGFVTVPAAADIDGDAKPDILLGNYKGGLYYLASQQVILSVSEAGKAKNAALKIYPNPANKTAYIQLPENASGHNIEINITNTLGQQVYKQSVKNTSGQAIGINTSNWARGVYFVSVNNAEGKYFSAKLYIAY